MLTIHDINMMHNVVPLCATKEQIKKALGNQDLTNFNQFFEKSKWVPTGKYTKDNKRLYVFLKEDEYWHEGVVKKEANLYSNLKLLLLSKFGNVTIDYILSNPSEEVSKLLKQYFDDSNF